MQDPVLLTERMGAVAILTMNRPSTLNALNQELIEALGSALESVASERSVRAVVLTGAGGAFCSGADLKGAMTGGDQRPPGARIDVFHRCIRAITHAPKPFVAAVDGAAVGFGADLALACDLRVLSTKAYIQEKFVKIGLMPDGGGTFWMPRLVGLGRAMEYLLLGTKIEASVAYEVGLANRVVSVEQLDATARGLAAELALGPPLALEQIKHAVREGALGTIDKALDLEKAGQTKLLATADLTEGIVAWAGRREPVFKGE